MQINKERELQIQRLQQNLASIRKLAGWTAEALGDKIGVTKQTISNLENNKNPMNFTQYIAIRTILDDEIENNQENKVLKEAVEILLDRTDIGEEDYTALKESISAISVSAAGGIAGATIASLFAASIVPIIGPAFIVSSVVAKHWLGRKKL